MAQSRTRSHFLVALVASALTALKRSVFAPVVHAGHVRYEAPIAGDLVTIVADVGLANGALTIAAQPDVPRKLQVRITDANSSISAGTVTLVGVGARGQAVSQVIALAGGTRTVTTDEAFATLTSATVASLAGAATGDNIGIGPSNALGLPVPQGARDVAVHKANVANANEAVGTVDATAGTIVPTTAPNGTRVFDFWFTYRLHAGAANGVHLDQAEYAVTEADATDLATSIVLCKAIVYAYLRHVADTLAHTAADTTNDLDDGVASEIVAAIVDLASTIDAANTIKAAYNTHRSQAGVHNRDDAANAVASADATDLSSLLTLLNELKADFNAHMAAGPSAPSWRAED